MDTTADVKPEASDLPPTYAPWPGESDKHRQAFEDYWDLGPDRSRQELLRQYQAAQSRGEKPPCTTVVSMSRWSKKFCWDDRVAQRDAERRALGQTLDDGELARKRHKAMTDREASAGKKGLLPEYVEAANQALSMIEDMLAQATPSSAPKLIEQKFSIMAALGLGTPLVNRKWQDPEEDRERETWDLPPGMGRLSFEENEVMYRFLMEAKEAAIEEIKRMRRGEVKVLAAKPWDGVAEEAEVRQETPRKGGIADLPTFDAPVTEHG